MFLLKACPRCAGDLFTGIDDDLTCMQCGKDVGPELWEQLRAQALAGKQRNRREVGTRS
jgi:rubredoxin